MDVIVDTGIRGKALCSFIDGSLLVYKKGIFYIYKLKETKPCNVFRLPISTKKKLLCQSRLFERVLHIEPRWAIPIDDKNAFVLFGDKLYRLNIVTGDFSCEPLQVRGKPLSITRIEEIDGFKNSFVLGDYGLNSCREQVKIYQYSDCEKRWDSIYTFKSGTIRHIHAIVPDKFRNRVLILTGDEDAESGIWAAYDNFARVEPILVGEQRYRACQAIPYRDEIYFLSDKPSECNYVWKIKEKDKTILNVASLRGSCIYGRVVGENGFFSTTCEPDAHAKNRIGYWLSTRPGKGVKDHKIDIFVINSSHMEVIGTFQGDGLPLRLFQYATATFAYSADGNIYFTPVCVRKYDMHVFMVNAESFS